MPPLQNLISHNNSYLVVNDILPSNQDWIYISSSEFKRYSQGDIVVIKYDNIILFAIIMFSDKLLAGQVSYNFNHYVNEIKLEVIASNLIAPALFVQVNEKEGAANNNRALFYHSNLNDSLVISDSPCLVSVLSTSTKFIYEDSFENICVSIFNIMGIVEKKHDFADIIIPEDLHEKVSNKNTKIIPKDSAISSRVAIKKPLPIISLQKKNKIAPVFKSDFIPSQDIYFSHDAKSISSK